MIGRTWSLLKTVILPAVSGTGLIGLAIAFGRPIYRGIDVIGNIDFVRSYWGNIGSFLDSGWGTLTTIMVGMAIVAYAIYRGLKSYDNLQAAALVAQVKCEHRDRAELELSINTFAFLNPSDNDVYKLPLRIKALEAINLTRIIALINLPGRNGCYQLDDFKPPRKMVIGETIDILMHYRRNVGSFWGNSDRITESKRLDHLDKEERELYIRRYIHARGSCYCQVVVEYTEGASSLHLTIMVPAEPERPNVFTSSDHKDYDPDRVIHARGTFIS